MSASASSRILIKVSVSAEAAGERERECNIWRAPPSILQTIYIHFSTPLGHKDL